MATTPETELAVMNNTISNIEKTVNNIDRRLEQNYVTKDAHALIIDKVDRLEKIVYGVIMLILAGMVSGLVLLKK